jgi:hypothetical protein
MKVVQRDAFEMVLALLQVLEIAGMDELKVLK